MRRRYRATPFAPSSESQQLVRAADSALPRYAADDFPSNAHGHYHAALVIFERVYDRSPVGVPRTAVVDGRAQSWSVATVRLLQVAAAVANAAEETRLNVARRSTAAALGSRQ